MKTIRKTIVVLLILCLILGLLDAEIAFFGALMVTALFYLALYLYPKKPRRWSFQLPRKNPSDEQLNRYNDV